MSVTQEFLLEQLQVINLAVTSSCTTPTNGQETSEILEQEFGDLNIEGGIPSADIVCKDAWQNVTVEDAKQFASNRMFDLDPALYQGIGAQTALELYLNAHIQVAETEKSVNLASVVGYIQGKIAEGVEPSWDDALNAGLTEPEDGKVYIYPATRNDVAYRVTDERIALAALTSELIQDTDNRRIEDIDAAMKNLFENDISLSTASDIGRALADSARVRIASNDNAVTTGDATLATPTSFPVDGANQEKSVGKDD